MAEIIDITEYKRKKKKKSAEDDSGKNIAQARERDAGWRVFAQTVKYAKNKGLTAKQAIIVAELLAANFHIEPEEIKINDLIRVEFAGHSPDPRFPTDRGDDIILSLVWAIQQKLLDWQRAIRIIEVITVWYRLDPEKMKKI